MPSPPLRGALRKRRNGYSWVEGRVANASDPSGLCFERILCHELILLELYEAYNAVGCDSDKPICGYDVSEWFLEELLFYRGIADLVSSHYRYSEFFVYSEPGIINWFRSYAPQIPYKWMNFAVSGQYCECPSGPQCTRSVTLCGKCIDRSELGNIMFGYIGGSLSITPDFLFGSARAVDALRGEAEQATAGIGIYLSTQTFNSTSDLCHHIASSSGQFTRAGHWDWNLANAGQRPDVSQCAPCDEPLPPYPHTIPVISDPAGVSIWADNSVISEDFRPGSTFYTAQIPGIDYLSPELCADLDIQNELCGTSMFR